ncbi:MAG: VCBS repeat-containing protein [Polyangiaceae bacterium]
MPKTWSSWFLLLPCVIGCSTLEDISAGVCGNGIVEGDEDCDGEGSCGKPGSTSECRFVCDTTADCRKGSYCGLDGVCREPEGSFSVPESGLVTDQQTRVQVGDFDGNGIDDLVSVEESGRFAVRYFESGGVADTRFVQSGVFPPSIGRLTGDANGKPDATDDIVHTGGLALGVLEASTSRDLQAKAYAPIPVNELDSRFVTMEGKLPAKKVLELEQQQELILFGGTEILQFTGSTLRSVVDGTELSNALPVQAFSLVPDPNRGSLPTGQLDEGVDSLCDELVLMQPDDSQVYVVTPCVGQNWNLGLTKQYPSVGLPIGGKVGKMAVLGDIDGDQHLDIVVAGPNLETDPERPEVNELYAAFGNGNGTFRDKDGKPDVMSRVNQPGKTFPGIPLAAGRLNADNKADFVFPGGIVLSQACAPGPDCYEYIPSDGKNFEQAVIADLNSNGLNDIVARTSDSRGVIFLNGTGVGIFNAYEVPTANYPTQLAVADFDGDLVKDVAVAERENPLFIGVGTKDTDPILQTHDSLSILFGKVQGAPEPPVSMGKLGLITGIAPGNFFFKGFDSASDIGVLTQSFDGALSVALFGGSTDRHMASPFELTEGLGENPEFAFLTQTGRFAGEAHPDVAVLSFPPPDSAAGAKRQPAKLWLAPSTGEAELSAQSNHATSMEGVDIDPCTVLTPKLDLDGDGQDELVMLGRASKRGEDSGRVLVARSTGGAWKLDPVIKIPGVPFTNERTARINCRYLELGGLGKPYVADFIDDGTLQVADADANGAEDLLAFSVLATFDGTNISDPEFHVSLFLNGDLANPLALTLPADFIALGAALINADLDPELELLLVGPSGVFRHDVDLGTGQLSEPLPIFQNGGPAIPLTSPLEALDLGLTGIVTGDFNGDKIPDFVVSDRNSVNLFLAKAVKP